MNNFETLQEYALRHGVDINERFKEIEADLKRYEWIRKNLYMHIGNALGWGYYPSIDDKVAYDHAIDAAMEKLGTV